MDAAFNPDPGGLFPGRRVLAVACVVWAVCATPAFAAGSIDPALNGTWKLDWPGGAIYWAVREDGVYRFHGPGAKPAQLGILETGPGSWSIKSAFWQDGGTYRLIDANTWQATGKLGPGTWKRVWAPATSPVSSPGACSYLTADEAALVLRAPVTAEPPDPRRAGACVFKSQLNPFDQLTVTSHLVSPRDWHLNRQSTGGAPKADIPGIAAAYASVDGGNYLVGRILKGSNELLLRVSLTPPATLDDARALAPVARAIDRRASATTSAPNLPLVVEQSPVEKNPLPARPIGAAATTPAQQPKPSANYVAPRLPDPQSQQQYTRATDIYNAKHYTEALEAFLPVATRGDSRAQAMLGNIHHYGKGTPVDEAKAFYWYDLAARQGNRQGLFYLGEMYWEGWPGTPKDYTRAAALMEAAALKGLKEAQTALGFMYEFGQGVPRNRKIAIHWMTIAAKQGDGGGGWIAEWLRNPNTPHFANGDQLGNYINAKITAWTTQYGGGDFSSSSGGSTGGGSGGGCSYSSPAACNAAKAGDLWAADRIENRRSNESEKAWYGR